MKICPILPETGRTAPRSSVFNGHTEDQIETTLQAVAKQALVLRDHLSALDDEVCNGLDFRPGNRIEMAAMIAAVIGAQVDQLLGMKFLGPVASWLTGDGIDLPDEKVGAA